MYAKLGLILICAMVFSGCNHTLKPSAENEFVRVISGEVYFGKYALGDAVDAAGWIMNDSDAKGYAHLLVDVPSGLDYRCRKCRYDGRLKLRLHARQRCWMMSSVIEVLDLEVQKPCDNHPEDEKDVSVIVVVEANPEDFSKILATLKSKDFYYARQILAGKMPGKYYLVGLIKESKISSLKATEGVVGVSKNSGVGPN